MHLINGENNLISLSDIQIALPTLQDIIDESALKIISSIIAIEKNVFQNVTNLPALPIKKQESCIVTV